jgi:hypothetical protein
MLKTTVIFWVLAGTPIAFTACSSRASHKVPAIDIPLDVARARVHAMFVSNDTNHDGCLSREEWLEGTRKSAQGVLNSGGPELREGRDDFVSRSESFFNAIDHNHDNCVTEEEYLADWVKSRRGR